MAKVQAVFQSNIFQSDITQGRWGSFTFQRDIFQSVYEKDTYQSNVYQDDVFSSVRNINKVFDKKFPPNSGIGCVSTGMNWIPVTEDSLKYDNILIEVDYSEYSIPITAMNNRMKEWDHSVKNSLSLYEYLKKEIYYD